MTGCQCQSLPQRGCVVVKTRLLVFCRPTCSLVTATHFQYLLQISRCLESPGCSVELSCVKPDPPAPLREANLLEVVRDAQCEIGCIEQHGVALPGVHTNSLWPSLEFDALKEDCPLYQKIYECKMGCVNHYVNPVLTVNKCRDGCYTECQSNECNRQPCEGMPCGRQCRKTYCRFGCMLYDTLNELNKTHHTPLPVHPSVTGATPTEGAQERLYMVTPSLSTEVSSSELPVVGYILRMSSPEQNHISYLWQRNLSALIDLSPYACHRLSLSYAVISTHTPLEDIQSLPFSPDTEVCVPGLGGRPSQVTSLWVTYTEDFRQGFHGYSIAKVNWIKPEGYQYVTSYSLSVYPDRDSCGGVNVVYKYNNIDKEVTSFSVSAKEPIGLMKFGCSFLFELIALPAERNIIGPSITKIAALEGPTPQISVHCERIWDKTSGHFNISISWGLLPNTTQTSHITRFTLTPMLLNNGLNTTRYSPLTLTPQDGEDRFRLTLPGYEPYTDQEYKIEVQSSMNSNYHWRRNPSSGSCIVSAEPHSPSFPDKISVSRSTFNPTRSQLTFQLKWMHPNSYGGVVRYELQVTAAGVQHDLLTFPADTSLASVTSTLSTNGSTHCAYVQMRTVNSFSLVSDWSEPLVLPLDDQCVTDTSNNTGKISMFYETKESGAVKLLELGCHSDSALFGGDTQSGLTKTIKEISQRVNNISSVVERDQSQLAAFERALQRVEQKLDALLDLVAIHVHA